MKPIYLNKDRTSWMIAERGCLVVFSEVTVAGHKTQSRAVIPWRVLWQARSEMEKERNRDIRPKVRP